MPPPLLWRRGWQAALASWRSIYLARMILAGVGVASPKGPRLPSPPRCKCCRRCGSSTFRATIWVTRARRPSRRWSRAAQLSPRCCLPIMPSVRPDASLLPAQLRARLRRSPPCVSQTTPSRPAGWRRSSRHSSVATLPPPHAGRARRRRPEKSRGGFARWKLRWIAAVGSAPAPARRGRDGLCPMIVRAISPTCSVRHLGAPSPHWT